MINSNNIAIITIIILLIIATSINQVPGTSDIEFKVILDKFSLSCLQVNASSQFCLRASLVPVVL